MTYLVRWSRAFGHAAASLAYELLIEAVYKGGFILSLISTGMFLYLPIAPHENRPQTFLGFVIYVLVMFLALFLSMFMLSLTRRLRTGKWGFPIGN